jgi:hypothetical protein
MFSYDIILSSQRQWVTAEAIIHFKLFTKVHFLLWTVSCNFKARSCEIDSF